MAEPDEAAERLAAQIAHEQEVVDEVYGRLDELREASARSLAQVRSTRAEGTHQARSERDSFAALYADRVATYDAVEHKLVFGRLDLAPTEDDENDDDEAAPRYVGRIGLSDPAQTPILTDWRAPAARPFYQATAANPAGVARRRHLSTRDRRVTALEDDVLDAGALDAKQRGSLAGEGALMAALGEHRTGRMQDIVATIQAEQDEIIRSDVEGVLVVQGGPGTGKTAVALHRAAYLLYAHRERMTRAGVLLVGPSDAFLHYIEKVLPALGETGVVSTTMGSLLPGITARADDDALVARIKGRREWVEILARAVAARQRVPDAPIPFRLGSVDLQILPADVASARARARRAHQPHNVARNTFVRTMLNTLATQYGRETGSDISGEDLKDLVEDLRTHRDVRVALNLAWFPLSAEGLLRDLYTKPHRLAEAAPALSTGERHLLQRTADAPWTVSDVPLLDEAWELIGDPIDPDRQLVEAAATAQAQAELEYARATLESYQSAVEGLPEVAAADLAARMAPGGPLLTTAERAAADRSWTYGHIVVDEAQELSPMAWRSLLRRCPSRSFTVVGDTGQTSSGAGARRWSDVLDPLGINWRMAQLTINYRTPRTVMDAATAVLHETLRRENLHPDIAPVTSVRDLPGSLQLASSLPAAVSASLRLGGTTCVVAPADQVAELRAELGAPGLDLTRPLVVLTAQEAKGLEFDAVIAIDVAHLGPGDAYVAMSRATRRLTMLGALPDGLPGDLPRVGLD